MRWRRLSKVAGFEERSDGGLEVSTFAKALPTLRDAGPPKKKKVAKSPSTIRCLGLDLFALKSRSGKGPQRTREMACPCNEQSAAHVADGPYEKRETL